MYIYHLTLGNIWELPCNFRVFIRVVEFYLFFWRKMRILVTADFCHILYVYKYVGMGSTQTPGTICAIPSGVVNCLDKLNLLKPSFRYEWVDKIYLDHKNVLRKAGLAPHIFPTIG